MLKNYVKTKVPPFQICSMDLNQNTLCFAEATKVHFCQLKSGKLIKSVPLDFEDIIKSVSLNGDLLMIGWKSGTIGILNKQNGDISIHEALKPALVTSICWTNTNTIFVGTNFGTVSKIEIINVSFIRNVPLHKQQ